MRIVEGVVDGLETDARMLCRERERKAEKCKIDEVLRHGASLVRDGEKMSFSFISSVLRESVILNEALLCVRKMCSPFGKDKLGSFVVLLKGVLGEEGFDGEYIEVRLTFVRNGYDLGGFVPSPNNYNKDDCFILQPEMWPHKVQRVLGPNEFRPSRNIWSSFVLLESECEEKLNRW